MIRSWREWVYGGPKKDGRFTDVSFVYILKGPDNLCKIGLSKEPIWRIRRHRGNCEAALELICLVRHLKAAELEIKLHKYFRQKGRKSPTIDECFEMNLMVGDWSHYDQQERQQEWFWLTDEDITWLRGKTTEEVDSC